MTDMIATSLLVEATVKVSLVLLLALAVVWGLRRRSAAARHWVLSVAVACALVVPVLSAVAPTWYVPVTGAWPVTAARLASGLAADPASPPGTRWVGEVSPVNVTLTASPGAVDTPRDAVRRMAGLLLPVWMVGVGAIVAVLLLGLVRLAWFSARATPVSDSRWLELSTEISADLGLARPVRLLQSDHPTLLATWGFVWPRVMLPAGAPGWDDDRRRIVLAHELAHVRRADWVVQMGADALRALFWFNPLMWIAARCLRRDSELACDDAVLGLGVDGPDYATQLLDLAKALRSPHTVLTPGVAMARPSGLERRINAMMNPSLSRQPFMCGSRFAIVVAALAVTVPLAVLAQSGSGSVSGTVVDSAGQPWAGARVTLTPVGDTLKLKGDVVVATGQVMVFANKLQVTVARNPLSTRSDDNGRFEIADLPPGDYRLEVRLPGFSPVEETVTVAAGQHVQREIALQIGSLEETYTVAAGAPAPVPTSRDPVTLERRRQRIGDGPLQPPIKLRGLNPAYPDALRASGTQGSVILDAVVAADGSIQVLNVLTPVDPDLLTPVQPELARAAVTAVRQWFYQPTTLHGVPVDTRMTVTINFTTES